MTGLRVVRIIADKRSSASPAATLEMMLAVAGQTRMTSGHSASEICSISHLGEV